MPKRGNGYNPDKTRSGQFLRKSLIRAAQSEVRAGEQHEMYDAKDFEKFNRELKGWLRKKSRPGKSSQADAQEFLASQHGISEKTQLEVVSRGLNLQMGNPASFILLALLFSQLARTAHAINPKEEGMLASNAELRNAASDFPTAVKIIFGGSDESIKEYKILEAKNQKAISGLQLMQDYMVRTNVREVLSNMKKQMREAVAKGIIKDDSLGKAAMSKMEKACATLEKLGVEALEALNKVASSTTNLVISSSSQVKSKKTRAAENYKIAVENLEVKIGGYEEAAKEFEKSKKSAQEAYKESAKKVHEELQNAAAKRDECLLEVEEFQVEEMNIGEKILVEFDRPDQVERVDELQKAFGEACSKAADSESDLIGYFLENIKTIILVSADGDIDSASDIGEVRVKYYQNEAGNFYFKDEEVLARAESFYKANSGKSVESPVAAKVVAGVLDIAKGGRE